MCQRWTPLRRRVCEEVLRLDIAVDDVPQIQRLEPREEPLSVAPDGVHVQSRQIAGHVLHGEEDLPSGALPREK